MPVNFIVVTISKALTIFKNFNLWEGKKRRLAVGIFATIGLNLFFSKDVLAASCAVDPNTIIAGEATRVTVSGLDPLEQYRIGLIYFDPKFTSGKGVELYCGLSPDAKGDIGVDFTSSSYVSGSATIVVHQSETTGGSCQIKSGINPLTDFTTKCQFTIQSTPPTPTPVDLGSCDCNNLGEIIDNQCNEDIAYPQCSPPKGPHSVRWDCDCKVGPSPTPYVPRRVSCIATCEGEPDNTHLNYCFDSLTNKCCYSRGAFNSPECSGRQYECDRKSKAPTYSCSDPDKYEARTDENNNCWCVLKGAVDIGEIPLLDAVQLCKPLCGQIPPGETKTQCECYDPVDDSLPCKIDLSTKKIIKRNKTFVRDHPEAEFSKCVSCVKKGWAYTALGCIPTNPVGFISRVFAIAIPIMSGILFLGLIYTGFLLITSTGDPEKIAHTKDVVKSLIFGALIILFSVFIYGLIGGTILGIPGFRP